MSGCKKEEDPCEGISCLNSGACNDGTCTCPTGWSGEFCQTSTDPCIGVNCANGGTCVNGTCNCPPGWSGPNCENSTNPCLGINCANGGTCINGVCDCPPGWSGTFCETAVTVDPCDGINCQNGGTCSNGICACPSGWTGTFCQTAVTPTGMKITQIYLSDWPAGNWDNFSEADIFMTVYRHASSLNIATSSNQCDDCVNYYTFSFTTPTMAVGDLFDLDCYDYDSTDPNDYMGGMTSFRPSNYMSGRPSTIDLTNGSFTMRLTVQWVY